MALKYITKTIVTDTIFIRPKDVPGIKPGDILSNTKDKNRTVIFDGGIDIHRRNLPVDVAQKEGRAIILDTNGNSFQYVLRRK